MELWIRSQDKTILQKVNKLYVCKYAEKKGYGIYDLLYNDLDDCDVPLGFYKTRERALEILNEIQNILMPRISYTPIIEEDIKPEYTYKHFTSEKGEVEILELNTCVYEMPKE